MMQGAGKEEYKLNVEYFKKTLENGKRVTF